MSGATRTAARVLMFLSWPLRPHWPNSSAWPIPAGEAASHRPPSAATAARELRHMYETSRIVKPH
jgi:predicted NUDIX family NTP pyrophosphohydrolase